MNKSKERAFQIISYHIENIKPIAPVIKSVILVGSLSDDSYTGNAGSDIDLIHILSPEASEEEKNTVYRYIEKTEAETNHDIPISKCIYRYADLFRPYRTDFELCERNRDLTELPIEILRMKDSGKVIYGEDIIAGIDTPVKGDIMAFHHISEKWSGAIAEQFPERHLKYLQTVRNLPVRLIAQSVLTRAMLDYYFATEKSCSSKAKILDKIKAEIPEYCFIRLLELSHKWRYHPDEITEQEQNYMTDEYQKWYSIRKEKPYDFIPREQSEEKRT